MKLILSLLILFLNGCAAWPTLTRPEAQFQIIDENNNPISKAKLKLITIKNPYSREVAAKDFDADSKGIIRISSERNWEYQNYLFPHGVAFYHWNFCASANGYNAKVGQITKNDLPKEPIIIRLTKSTSDLKCDQQLPLN